MCFINNSKFWAVVVLICMVGIGVADGAFAQEVAGTAADAVDTVTAVADTAAATEEAVGDTATDGDDTAAAAPAAAAGTTTVAPAAEESGSNIDPQVYMNFFYGLLLVFLICVLVGVIGKIIQVYELTRRMSGKDTTYYLQNFNARMFVIALILGLYGVYWSYVNHGSQSFRAAVTEHGARIDTMFIITT